ncbi:hypothetical protein ACX93W_26600 [Paenibacillus sp. CAU 1782]
MAYWGAIRGVGNPIPIRDFNGVYKPDDEGFNLPDNLFTELINFGPSNAPGLTTRPGYSVIGQTSERILGLGAWKDQELHVIFSDGTWQRWDVTGWSLMTSGLSTTAEWTFCNFKGNLSDINLIASNGVDPIKRYDGSTVQNLAGAPSGGNFITTHSNRLYCAVGNFLRYSALNIATDWTTAGDAGAGEIQVNTTDGETINGLSAGNGYITVFKPSSMFELYGKGPQSYAMESIATDIGAASNKAITAYDQTVPIINRDGIYQYSGGMRPRREYSKPVQNYVNLSNKEQTAKCVAASSGEYIYFGIPYGSSTNNSRILQYYPLHQTWYTWDSIAVCQMIRVGDKMYFGDESGRVLLLGGTTDNGTPITATAITKPFTSEAISRKMHWFKIWIVATIAAGSSLSVYISKYPSGEDWILAKTLTANTNMQFQEMLVPTNSIADANAVRIKIVATGPVSIHEISRQLRELPMRR